MSIEETLSRVWKVNGFIPGGAEWISAKFRIPIEKANQILSKLEHDEIVTQPTRQRKIRPLPLLKNDPHLLSVKQLKFMAYALALIAGIRSWVYVFEFYAKTDNVFLAAMMAALVVGATFVFPQIAVYAIKNKIKHRFKLATSIMILSLLSISFSMVATVAGIYDSRAVEFSKLANSIAEKKKVDIELAGLEVDYQRLIAESATLEKDIAELKELRKPEKPFSWQYNTFTKKIDAKEKRISEISGELTIIVNKKSEKSVADNRSDFYGWLSGQIGISRESLELTIAIVPALIVDLVGPIALGVGLFL
jgi:cell division protein FtsL